VANAEKVTAIYGTWPTFHDAEVLSLHLDRGVIPTIEPFMLVRVWTFKVHRDQIDSHGYYRRADYSIVTFRFDRPDELSIDGFNHQNVLSCIDLKLVDGIVHVVIDGIFGIHAAFRCSRVSVDAVEVPQPPV